MTTKEQLIERRDQAGKDIATTRSQIRRMAVDVGLAEGQKAQAEAQKEMDRLETESDRAYTRYAAAIVGIELNRSQRAILDVLDRRAGLPALEAEAKSYGKAPAGASIVQAAAARAAHAAAKDAVQTERRNVRKLDTMASQIVGFTFDTLEKCESFYADPKACTWLKIDPLAPQSWPAVLAEKVEHKKVNVKNVRERKPAAWPEEIAK